METGRIRRVVFWVGSVVILLIVLGVVHKFTRPVKAENVLQLESPSFLDKAKAESLSATSVITEEAGISAWFQAPTSINLDDVRGTFRTIETETSDYILGSVPLVDYPETEDVHVYVHTDGWILAYYLAADPAGKIFDWRAYHDGGQVDISTKLENAITIVANAASISFDNAVFYDFRYPNATHLMLVVEWVYSENYGSDSCEINLPSEFDYYHRSWSLAASDDGEYRLNGETIKSVSDCPLCTFEGTLTVSQLLPDQFHSIEVVGRSRDYVYGGLALVYGAP